MYPQRDEHDWDEHHWHEQGQIKQLVTNRNDITPWKGAKLGTVTASTLVLGYSLFMTLFSSFFAPEFGVILLVGVVTGMVPAMLVGLLGGGVLGAIYEGKPEPYNNRTAWMIGGGIGLIPVILYGLFVFRLPSGPIYQPSSLERFAASVFFLILPGIITVGALGWISQKLNRQIHPSE